ncbi:nucleotide sugar dehydrogenase [Candidatus Woesearchaeota archaeon]|nr:nucleotide sugar dehydrogenase [Candidatus Woesearchaeota archaeon]
MTIKTICVVGLGYVGLPLAAALSNNFLVIGFDVNTSRIKELQQGKDSSGEFSSGSSHKDTLMYTSDPIKIRAAHVVIVCVPTPIDDQNKPDLQYVESASVIVGQNLSPGTVVVYESTVYPGVTEEICIPLLEKNSGLRLGEGFKVGYSPERINPGDKEHTISKVVKIVSGSDEQALEIIDWVYSSVTTTHRAPSIKVAEAAKVIENIQRDLNIALMNELTLIFDKMNINIYDVMKAAGTKWNFHPYHPGLVGGHCIGVDPYYLTFKAKQLGYDSKVILAGRTINDAMHQFYAKKILQRLSAAKSQTVLMVGLTFKPDVPDYRNSRIKFLIEELQHHKVEVYAYDPFVPPGVVEKEFRASWRSPTDNLSTIALVIIAVEHQNIKELVQRGVFAGNEVVTLRDLATKK